MGPFSVEIMTIQNGNDLKAGTEYLDTSLLDFPLSVRAHNCFKIKRVKKVRELIQLTETDLLKWKNFGRKSLREVKDLLDTLGLSLGVTEDDIHLLESQMTPAGSSISSISSNRNASILTSDEDINKIFLAIPWMTSVVGKLLVRYIANPNATIANALGIKVPDKWDSKISDALSSLGFRYFGNMYDELLLSLSERQLEITIKRIHAGHPETLEELGERFGITRERVRQIEAKIQRRFAYIFRKRIIKIQTSALRIIIGKVLSYNFARRLSRTLVSSSRFPDQALVALLQLTGPYELIENWLVRKDVLKKIEQLRSNLINQADRIGRIDPLLIDREMVGLFRNDDDRNEFILDYLKFEKIYDEWVIRDSQRAKVFLSLYKIGKPATKEEIAKHAGIDNPVRVSSYLASVNFICRADKEKWAFIEWVDDPYDGIVGEIEQRINEDGGRTTVERLMEEIPRQFGVAETSVRAYLTVPLFVINDGYVRYATQEEMDSIWFGHAKDISNAYQLEDGAWAVKLSIEERFFNGYSAAIPAAIASACGLKIGDSLLVPVAGTEYTVSLIWRPSNSYKTVDLGRLEPVLRELEIKLGDEIIVAPSREIVHIYKAGDAPLAVSRLGSEEIEQGNIDTLIDGLFEKHI